MKIPRLYKYFYEQQVFILDQALNLIKNRKNALKQISYLIKKGYIKKIKKGAYYIVPIEYIGRKFIFSNKYLIASKLEKRYFLSYHTALELHGIAHSSFFKFFISTAKQPKIFLFEGSTYKKVYSKHFWGIEKKKLAFGDIYVTDIERTIIDCVDKVNYCASLEELIKSFETIHLKLDFNKLFKYLKKYNKKSLYAKIGFFLEFFKASLYPPEYILKKLKNLVGTHTYYLETKQGCKYNTKWNLMIPKNLAELMKGA